VKTWKARIVIGGKGSSVEIQVQAKNYFDAKKIILGQYGANTKILSGPTEVH
jgi:hypothetical protein